MWIGQRGETRDELEWVEELYIEKWKENSCFCYSTSFYGREFPIFRAVLVFVSNWPTASCILSNPPSSSVCLCEEKILQKFSSSFSFFMFSVAAVKFSTYVQNYMYVHIKSHFLKDMKTPLSSYVGGGWGPETRTSFGRNFHIYTQVLSSFFSAACFFAPIHP